MKNRLTVFILILALLVCTGGCSSEKAKTVKLDPDNPQVLTVWHYYNGYQQQVFDSLVQEFNDTVGTKEGIYVEAYSKGSIGELSDAVNASAAHEVGADELPTMFAAYADTAYDLEQEGILCDLAPYFTKEELEQYVPAYINEGYLVKDGELKLFPVAKSTEIFLLDETDWAEFAAQTGADKKDLTTWEGLVSVSEAYYNWTDAKTPDVEGDGRAFYGRDAFANYMLIGSHQLGADLFQKNDGKVTVQVDHDVMKKLWDCYYVPYVNGWFGAYGKFRSDDIKTGQIIALTGSTSGALYFPSEVTTDSGEVRSIECSAYAVPNFAGTKSCAVQQGAGMAVTRSTQEAEYASVVFLKWITEVDHNVDFSIDGGYFPVKKEANHVDFLEKKLDEKQADELLKKIISVGATTTENYELYTIPSFENADKARNIVQYSMPDAAAAAVEERDSMIASGMSREEAIAKLTDDAAFEAWLQEFETSLRAAVENTSKD